MSNQLRMSKFEVRLSVQRSIKTTLCTALISISGHYAAVPHNVDVFGTTITNYDESELWLEMFVCCQINIKIHRSTKTIFPPAVKSWLSKIKTLQRLSHGSEQTMVALAWLECHQSAVDRKPREQRSDSTTPLQLIQTHWSGFVSDPGCHLKYPMVLFSYRAPSVTFPLCLCVLM